MNNACLANDAPVGDARQNQAAINTSSGVHASRINVGTAKKDAHPHDEYNNQSTYCDQSSYRMEPAIRQQLLVSLMNGVGDPFDGKPHQFWSWYHYINSRLLEVGANSHDTLYILKANTGGEVKKNISRYMSATMTNPSRILQEVWDWLRKRYGSDAQVSTYLLDQLENFQKIKNPQQVNEIQELYSICKVIEANKVSALD